MAGPTCDSCRRYHEVCGVVSHWLQVEIGNVAADQVHLVATMNSCIQALGPGNPRLHPPPAVAHAMAHPAAGEDLDDQAARLVAGCPPGSEEAEAVVLRRAAELLLARAHGKAGAYRGAQKGAYRVPLRLIDPEDLKIP